MSNQPHASQGASDRAYQTIRSEILDGAYRPGAVLAEAELAKRLGVSRTPVREALQLLQQEELLEPGPRRQMVVIGVSSTRRREVLLLRTALEEVSIREACGRLTGEQLDELRLTLFRQQRAAKEQDVTTFLNLDDHFHLSIARGSDMPMLERFLDQLRAFVRLMGRDAVAHEGRLGQVLAEHEAILQALEAADRSAALEALDKHLAATATILDIP